MRLTDAGVTLLAALDHGAYREAIDRYESTGPSTDSIETIWRAEVAVYLARLDEAREELARLPVSLDRELTNRVNTLRAEILFWDKALDEAREAISPVIQSTWEIGDHQGHLRATLLRARTELRRGNSAEALERLKEPRRLATVLGNDYYAGIIAHCRAFAHYNLGDYKQAGHAFAEALRLLKSSEGLRWEMACRILHAGFLADLGNYDESLAQLDECERVALDLGLVESALYARNNAAGTLFTLGRYEEAVERLKDLLTWERATCHVFAEMVGLLTMSTALGELGRFDEAQRAASEAAHLANLSNSASTAFDADVIRNWAGARAGAVAAADSLARLVAIADESESEQQKCESRLYYADAIASTQPDRAWVLCREARAFPISEEHMRIRTLLERVETTIGSGPLRIGPGGELVIDPKAGAWPDYDLTIEAVKRFLVLGAVHASNGNRSEAARKLNLTRSRLHDIWRQIHGEPPRPPRGSQLAHTVI